MRAIKERPPSIALPEFGRFFFGNGDRIMALSNVCG